MKDYQIGCVYFFKDINNELLYIGKTYNLKNRLRQHLSDPDEWKKDIHIVEYMVVENEVDRDIIETYCINIHKPIYNKDKVFGNIKPTIVLDLPITKTVLKADIIPVTIKGNLKTIIKMYCEDDLDLDTAITLCPLLQETNTLMNKEDYKRLCYQPSKIRNELNNLKSEAIISNEIKKQFTTGFYSSKDIKVILSRLYTDLGINKKAKSTDIEKAFAIKPIKKRIADKVVLGYQL